MDYVDIIKAVERINEDIFERTSIEYMFLTYSTNGYGQHVDFGDVRLWDDDQDTRVYEEATDEYESIEDCLRRCFADEVEKINSLIPPNVTGQPRKEIGE